VVDPISVGTFVSWALGLAGEEILKGTVGEAVKDAYAALKAKVAGWAGGDVDSLEKSPASPARQAVIAETIDGLSADDQAKLHALAQALADRLKETGGPVGIDMTRLTATEVKVSKLSVASGVGAVLTDATVSGAVSAGDIVVGAPPGKP
jgi:hypothetical protein